VLTRAFYPVLCGSAFKNKGVQPLLDAVVDYLPSPVDVPAIKGIDSTDGNEVVFARRRHRAAGAARVQDHGRPVRRHDHLLPHLFGRAREGTGVVNSTRDKKERVGRMLLMHANNREDIKEAYAGDIVALAGLKEVRTGDTLCDPDKPVILERWNSPSRSSKSRSSRSRRPTRKSWASRWRSSLPRIRPSAFRPTRSPARPFSRAWANFISTSRSTS
jgi:elongation factor G